ncbi:MAG: hypothetical protein IJY04_09550 [Clostridia bacterium]|nr:hypothetical protein [Clostridia bacterium]
MKAVSKFIRRFTVPPVFAVALLLTVYVARPEYVGEWWLILVGVFFLAILPTLAYPMQKLIPHFKDGGRKAQRTLAMIFSFFGYLGGAIVSAVASAPAKLKLIFFEYLVCGVLMIVLNKLLHIKASGHACGVVGPVMMLAFLRIFIPAIVGAALIVPVYVSSVKTKQHTVGQLIWGSAIPFIALAILLLLGFGG